MKWLILCVSMCLARGAVFGAYVKKERKTDVQLTTNDGLDPPEYGPECLVGSKWTSRCNQCHCTVKGRAVCTKNVCETHNNEPEKHCAPNTYWKNDCNSCFCTETGFAACTEMGCLHEAIETEHKTTTLKPEILAKGKECAIGTSWKNGCIECVCSLDGSASCKEMECADKSEKKLKCAPDSNWRDDCNTCWCQDGDPVCTRIACHGTAAELHFDDDTAEKDNSMKASRIKRATQTTQESPKACTPGQEFRMDCNTCLCDNEGQDFSCTRIDCNNNNNKPSRRRREVSNVDNKCTPGSVFERDCNVCRCSNDGLHATCTLHRCDKSLDHGKVDENEEESNFRCNPGEQFKRNCNDCTCSADGKSVFCTVHFCDEDINAHS